MKTVKEVSAFTGVSVRTLHHYDAIGLLKPSRVTEAGYRLYDDAALQRLQSILLFRTLRFSLKEIGQILDSPHFNPQEALEQQLTMLELQRQQLDETIAHVRKMKETGVITMNFDAFNTDKLDRYAEEAKAKWGKTEAYKEFEKKTDGQSKEQMAADGEGLMAIFAELGAIRHTDPASKEAQTLIAKLQAFITDHYYTCTQPILKGLGQLYIAGDSMTENIDRVGGEGTAEFAHKAIEIYTR
ncbi:MAG: MerR family transcriptional regulator [Oscillospiraceae bacterium]|nr:MerR family transcriptional regulator [Oscillospiraceae bacterium]